MVNIFSLKLSPIILIFLPSNVHTQSIYLAQRMRGYVYFVIKELNLVESLSPKVLFRSRAIREFDLVHCQRSNGQ